MRAEVITLPAKQSSFWLNSSKDLDFPQLKGEVECDVAIIGGGIAGLTAAYKLKQAGKKVVILEKNTVASGTTGGTTGKVTTQHGLIYEELTTQFGKDFARQYADLCVKAFDDTQQLIKAQKIECDWHTADNFVYTTDTNKVGTIRKEAAAAESLNLPASFVNECGLPFKIQAAVKFSNQAYFNAAKYVRSIAKLVNGKGSYVFENSQATSIKTGSPCQISTKNGKVIAKYIIVATKVPPSPLVGRLSYAINEYPVTSYIIAGLGLLGIFTSGHLFGFINVDPFIDVVRIILAAYLVYAAFIAKSERMTSNGLLLVGALYVGMAAWGLFDSTLAGMLPSGLTGFDVVFHLVTGIAALVVAMRHSRASYSHKAHA